MLESNGNKPKKRSEIAHLKSKLKMVCPYLRNGHEGSPHVSKSSMEGHSEESLLNGAANIKGKIH